MEKPRILYYDTKDDRRSIHQLLARLHPRRRIAFMRWCCSNALLAHGQGAHPRVAQKTLDLASLAESDDSADVRLSMDLFMDLVMTSLHFRFDLDKALERLVGMVRRDTR
jgi:hypothetical protein